jgi:hypothetical protein
METGPSELAAGVVGLDGVEESADEEGLNGELGAAGESVLVAGSA